MIVLWQSSRVEKRILHEFFCQSHELKEITLVDQTINLVHVLIKIQMQFGREQINKIIRSAFIDFQTHERSKSRNIHMKDIESLLVTLSHTLSLA